MKVDGEGRLFVAGRRSGRAWVYDTDGGALIQVLDTEPSGEDTLINDVTVTDEAAYLTDSFRPILFRVPLEDGGVGDIEPWLELRGTPIPDDEGFNLNGIAASDDGRHLVTVHAGDGGLYRIDTETEEVVRVETGDRRFPGGDGLLLDGRSLFVVVNQPEPAVVPVELSPDLASGEVGEPITDDSFDYPTTVAQCGTDRLQVVSSQLDDEDGGDPDLPFTVSEVPADVP
jgi:Cu-Zn family superoxide dismutase